MKLPRFPSHISRSTFRDPHSRRRERGMAVIVVMALIVLILIYVMANLRTFNALSRELRLLERQQTRRLQVAPPASKAVTDSGVATNSIASPLPRP